jgi:tetratricopeptide (TPR) repeat protein
MKQKIKGHYSDQPGKRPKKIPRILQQKIGEATNLYTFGKFDEAIPLFEEVLKEMPELAEVTHTMSLIHEEKGDLPKAFTFAFLSAIETRTDTDKWK